MQGNGEVGYAVSDTDPLEIADAVERICSSYLTISKQAFKRVGKFRWDKICERYRKIYADILANR